MHADRAWLGGAIFACLLAATLATAVLVVRARTPDLVLEVTDPPASRPAVLRPGGTPPRTVTIAFFVREADPDALVGIVDSRERLVRTLDDPVALARRQPVTYTWDGSGDDGAPVPGGRYRLLVALPGADREMIWPRRITVVRPADEPAAR